MIKTLVIICVIAFIVVYFTISILKNLKTEMNSVQIDFSVPNVSPISIKVAVIGDIHLAEGEDITKFLKLLDEVKSKSPDLVLLVGDYISGRHRIKGIDSHRRKIINTFKSLDPIPRAVVLGNHDNETGREKWFAEFKRLGVDVLENETRIMNVADVKVCVRGLGDYRSHRFKFVDYPAECQNLPKITITHDPQGAFEPGVEGLVFAGHTHCGQVSFPIIGPLKVPTKAPRAAICGLYKDSKRTLFVTSGVGTSIIPIRYGAQSQWDLINLSFIN
jgi:predicted MPP superfamily phosphohydrolase